MDSFEKNERESLILKDLKDELKDLKDSTVTNHVDEMDELKDLKDSTVTNHVDKMDEMKDLEDSDIINHAIETWKHEVPQERLEKVSKMFDKGVGLIGTEYNLGGTLGNGRRKGIDCSHFVAYSLGLQSWQKENTRSLDNKYKKHEVILDDAKPGDLLMWPWHYDKDVGRNIGHVEIVVGKTLDGRIITLGASGMSRQGDKYTVDGEKLPKHNCVGFSIREKEEGMRILRS